MTTDLLTALSHRLRERYETSRGARRAERMYAFKGTDAEQIAQARRDAIGLTPVRRRLPRIARLEKCPVHGAAEIIDDLTALPDRTPLEERCLNALIAQTCFVDRAEGLLMDALRVSKRVERETRDDRARVAALHAAEVDHLKARIATLTRQLAEERATHA